MWGSGGPKYRLVIRPAWGFCVQPPSLKTDRRFSAPRQRWNLPSHPHLLLNADRCWTLVTDCHSFSCLRKHGSKGASGVVVSLRRERTPDAGLVSRSVGRQGATGGSGVSELAAPFRLMRGLSAFQSWRLWRNENETLETAEPDDRWTSLELWRCRFVWKAY